MKEELAPKYKYTAVKYKSDAVKNLSDSYLRSLLKKEFGPHFPISDDMITVKRFRVLFHRLERMQLTKKDGFKLLDDFEQFFIKAKKGKLKSEIELKKLESRYLKGK